MQRATFLIDTVFLLCYNFMVAAREGSQTAQANPQRRDWIEEVLFMYAIIATGGKQYRVSEGDIIFVEKIDAEIDSTVEFKDVIAISADNKLTAGRPTVEGASVQGKVLAQGKEKKVVIFKFKAKKDYRKKQGHRQPYTKVQIEKINA
jgi:large subunit ribosomal protein L21